MTEALEETGKVNMAQEVAIGAGIAVGGVGGGIIVAQRIASSLDHELHQSTDQRQPPSLSGDIVPIVEYAGIISISALLGAVVLSTVTSRVQSFKHRRQEQRERRTSEAAAAQGSPADSQRAMLESWARLDFKSKNIG